MNNQAKQNKAKYTTLYADCQNALDIDLALDLLENLIVKERAKIALKFLPYYKPHKLAKLIGVSHQTIYNWINEFGPELLKGGENS